MVGVQEHTSRLIGLFVSCVLYGILLTTFVPCIRALLFSSSNRFQFKSRRDIKFPILAASLLMFLIASFAIGLAMQVVIDGFIDYDGPGGALEYYSTQLHGWKHWMLAVESAVQVVTGDGLLLYRCFVLYDRKWRAITVPAGLWVTLVVIITITSYRDIVLPMGTQLDAPTVLPFLTATLLLTFSTSLVTTYFIIRRLLRTDKSESSVIKPHVLTYIATIFMESGLIYTLSVVASLGIYLFGHVLDDVASLAMIQIIPITCNLLLIRVGGINRVEPLVKMSQASQVKKLAAEEV